jgi:hypothetical protein
MSKKLLFVTVLLLVVSVQVLTTGCDVRCASMGASTDHHASHSEVPMSHCPGMSMESGNGPSLTASDSCAATTCGTELKAINKNADQSDADLSTLLVSAVAYFVDPFGSSGSDGTTAFASFSRRRDGRPLAQRPGSSLRI